MDLAGIFAVVSVSDLERSVEWYTRLVGRPPDERPMEGLVQWRLSANGGLQLVMDARTAGSSMVTIITPHLDDTRISLAAASVHLEPDIQGDFGVLAQISDPDGNRLTLAEPPRGI